MSKIRNRSVNKLPCEFLVSHLKHTENGHYFGENIQDANEKSLWDPFSEKTPYHPHSFSTAESSAGSITLDLNKLSGISSSSSLSWSDEYESETTKIVYDELHRMDRVLRGEEPIPSHYDRDEYEQWMNTFPNISIFDSEKTPVNSTQNIIEKVQEEEQKLIVYGSEKQSSLRKNCDIRTSGKSNSKNLSVIKLSEISANRLLNQRCANIEVKINSEHSKLKNRNIFTSSNQSRSFNSEKYLKISPLRNDRKPSSKSLLNRQVSKEYSDASPEYNSLPFIEAQEVHYENKKSSNRPRDRKHPIMDSTKRKNSNRLVLPPIVNNMRSISATPRQGYKTFSALSVNSNFTEEKAGKVFLDDIISKKSKKNGTPW